MTRKKADQKKMDDRNVVLFQGSKPVRLGDVELHAFADLTGKLFGRTLKDVKADWKKVSGQIKEMMESVAPAAPAGFSLDSVEVSLGFSAEGKLVFVAEAGVEASVSLTFKRP